MPNPIRPVAVLVLMGLAAAAILATLLALTLRSTGAQENDPERAAYDIAVDVARATDAGDNLPDVPDCTGALGPQATERICEAYYEALTDFLEDAEESCAEGYLRAEDLSCVPENFYDRASPRHRAARGGAPVQQHEVNPETWDGLLRSGWRGDPNDGAEALYPPRSDRDPGSGAVQ